MKRMAYLVTTLFLITFLIAVAGCGQVKEEPNDSGDKKQVESVSEKRESAVEEPAGDLSEEKIVEESNKTVMEELAGLEAGWSKELHQLVVKSDDLTDQWLYGDMVYNTYIMELYEVKQDFDRLYEKCVRVYDEKGFAEKLKDEPKYTKGLVYGAKLRETVREFFDTTYGTSKESTGADKMDVSGEEFKAFYEEKMVNEYNDNYRKLNAALSEFK